MDFGEVESTDVNWQFLEAVEVKEIEGVETGTDVVKGVADL